MRSFILGPRAPGSPAGPQGLGAGGGPALPQSPWPRQSPGSRGGPQLPPSGTVRGEPSVPSPGEAVSAGRPRLVAARRATYPPRAQSSSRAQRRVLRSHPAHPQAWVPPLSHTRRDIPDAGSRRVSGTLTWVFAPPPGTDAASRCPSPAPRGGGASARASPGGGWGEGGAGRRRPAPGDRLRAPSPRAPRTVLMRAAQPL